MKICCTCKTAKSLDDFPPRKDAKDGHRGECYDCRSTRNRAYYLAHQDERIERQRDYYTEHKAEYAAQRRVYYEANKEAILAYQVQYRAEHKEQMRDYFREHYRRHGANKRAYNRETRDRFRGRIRASNNFRKARQRNAPICDLTSQQWADIQAAYDYRCAYCGCVPDELTMDHVIPLSRGGNHTASNIVPACLACNMQKKAGPPPPFAVTAK